MNRRYKQCEDFMARQIGNETILVLMNGEACVQDNVYALNPTASYIWEQIDGKNTNGDIRDLVISEFKVDYQEAEDDLKKCIEQLLQIKGISEVDIQRGTSL